MSVCARNKMSPLQSGASTQCNRTISERLSHRLRKHGLTPMLCFSVFTTCFGSSFLIGYNMGVLNLPARGSHVVIPCHWLEEDEIQSVMESINKHVKAFLSETVLHMDIDEAEKIHGMVTPSFLYAQISTTYVVAAAMGAFSCGWCAELLGRRNALLANHIFAIAGAVICSPCQLAQQAWLLFLGRFLLGINSGITIGVASIYLTEIAPRDLRGAIGACHQLANTVGILVAYLMTLTSTFNTAEYWPLAVGLGFIPAAFSLIMLPFCPESPRFLFLNQNREQAARHAFLSLQAIENVDMFIGELQEEIEVAKNQPKFKFVQLFKQKDLRMPVLIACLIQVFQQLSGINAVISYSSTMFKTAGLSETYIEYCVMAVGACNVLVSIASIPLLERAGRRSLLLWPSLLVAVGLLLLSVTVNLANSTTNNQIRQAMGILSVVLVFVYICGFAFGLGPVPALIVSEIFRQGSRAAAYSLSQSLQWLSSLIVLFSYPSINDAIGGYSFLPFLVVVVVCWVFFFLFMPETRNRTFDEVARDLAFGNIVIGRRTTTLGDRMTDVFQKDDQIEHQDENTRDTNRLID